MAGMLAVLVALSLYWVKFDGNITGFFRFGDRFPASPLVEQEIRITPGGQGYDGQFFLAIALDPFLVHPATARALDYPGYRYRRILYPFLGFVLACGQRGLIPYALVGINVACIPVLVWVAGLLLRRMGSESSVIHVLAIAPVGIWVSLCLAVSDVLGTTLFLLALERMCRGKVFFSAVLIGLAAMTRETYLATGFILGSLPLLDGRSRRVEWRYFLGIVPAACWVAYATWRLPAGANRFGQVFGAPCGGLWDKLQWLGTEEATAANMFDGFCFALTLGIAFLLAGKLVHYALARRSSAEHDPPASCRQALLMCALPGLLVILFGKARLFSHYAHYTRYFVDLLFLAWLGGEGTRWAWLSRGLAALSSLAGVAFVLHYAFS